MCELTPYQPSEGHRPHGYAKRAMQLSECHRLRPRRGEIDRKSEYEDHGDQQDRQPVQDPDRRFENHEFGILIIPQHPTTSLSSPRKGGTRQDSDHARVYSRGLSTPAPNYLREWLAHRRCAPLSRFGEEEMMRYLALIATLLMVCGCSSGSSKSATLTLDDPTWDRVNVQAVITKSSDCDERQNGYVGKDDFVMTKGHSRNVVAPDA